MDEEWIVGVTTFSTEFIIQFCIQHIQTSERLSSLYLIQRQIGASHNAYFKFYLSKKDGCIGNSVVCKVQTVYKL